MNELDIRTITDSMDCFDQGNTIAPAPQIKEDTSTEMPSETNQVSVGGLDATICTHAVDCVEKELPHAEVRDFL